MTRWEGGPTQAVATGALVSGSSAAFPGDSGYTFDLAYTFATSPATSDITNAAPGETDITWTSPLSIFATNTAQGRTSDWVYAHNLTVTALWPADSPLCATEIRNTLNNDTLFAAVQVAGAPYCGAHLLDLGRAGGAFAVAETRAMTGDASIAFTTLEASGQQIVDQLTAGPTGWVVSTGDLRACGGTSIQWVSSPALGCTGLGTIGTFPGDLDVSAALSNISTFNSDTAANQSSISDLGTCPLGDFLPYLAGLPADSAQSMAWDRTFTFEPVNGATCNSGGMQGGVHLYTGQEPDVFLVTEQGWEEVSQPVLVGGGTAFFSPRTIVPEGGNAYETMQYAWAKDGLIVTGRVVRMDANSTLFWLGQHLPVMIPRIAAWDWAAALSQG